VYTKQVGRLLETQGQAPSGVLEALLSVLGNCSAEIFHRAPLHLDVSGLGPQGTGVPCKDIEDPEVYSALHVKNQLGVVSTETGRNCTGMAVVTPPGLPVPGVVPGVPPAPGLGAGAGVGGGAKPGYPAAAAAAGS